MYIAAVDFMHILNMSFEISIGRKGSFLVTSIVINAFLVGY